MNNSKFHGITSLILFSISSLIALGVMVLNSWVWGVIYLAVLIFVPQVLLRAYCAKCPCKAHCGHVLPGKAAMKFEKDGPYTVTDFLIMGISMLLLMGLPQFWLWQYPILFGTYWILTGIALVQIRLTMCPNCNNVYCPARVRTQQQ
jgi:hypothetical protein